MPYGPIRFKASAVKPFLREEKEEVSTKLTRDKDNDINSDLDSDLSIASDEEFTPLKRAK